MIALCLLLGAAGAFLGLLWALSGEYKPRDSAICVGIGFSVGFAWLLVIPIGIVYVVIALVKNDWGWATNDT
jgi:hypothetical protein